VGGEEGGWGGGGGGGGKKKHPTPHTPPKTTHTRVSRSSAADFESSNAAEIADEKLVLQVELLLPLRIVDCGGKNVPAPGWPLKALPFSAFGLVDSHAGIQTPHRAARPIDIFGQVHQGTIRVHERVRAQCTANGRIDVQTVNAPRNWEE